MGEVAKTMASPRITTNQPCRACREQRRRPFRLSLSHRQGDMTPGCPRTMKLYAASSLTLKSCALEQRVAAIASSKRGLKSSQYQPGCQNTLQTHT